MNHIAETLNNVVRHSFQTSKVEPRLTKEHTIRWKLINIHNPRNIARSNPLSRTHHHSILKDEANKPHSHNHKPTNPKSILMPLGGILHRF